MGISQARLFNRVEFGQRLRLERQRTGLNQQDFGEAVGVSLQTQSRYEKGESAPNADYLAALAGKGFDLTFLLAGVRSEASAIGGDASELLALYASMPSRIQMIALKQARALAEVDQDGPSMPAATVPKALHAKADAYRAEDSGS